jgi:hypothetical protein
VIRPNTWTFDYRDAIQELKSSEINRRLRYLSKGVSVMPKHLMLVLTNPVEGKDAEYNEWYTNTHLPDILRWTAFPLLNGSD